MTTGTGLSAGERTLGLRQRIAVRFQYEWHNESGQWFRSYGNELWEFDDDGLMAPAGSQHQRRFYRRK